MPLSKCLCPGSSCRFRWSWAGLGWAGGTLPGPSPACRPHRTGSWPPGAGGAEDLRGSTPARAPAPAPALEVLCCHPVTPPPSVTRARSGLGCQDGTPGGRAPGGWWPPRGRGHPVPALPPAPSVTRRQPCSGSHSPPANARCCPPATPPPRCRLRPVGTLRLPETKTERPSARRRPSPAAVLARVPVRSQDPEAEL